MDDMRGKALSRRTLVGSVVIGALQPASGG